MEPETTRKTFKTAALRLEAGWYTEDELRQMLAHLEVLNRKAESAVAPQKEPR